jgi:hypothetical protein
MLQARMVPRNVCNLAEERTCARSTFCRKRSYVFGYSVG